MARGVRRSPRRTRLVADLVRGRKVDEALALLAAVPNAAAGDVAKVVRSAAANAENNYSLDREALVVARIQVDQSITLKRGQPRARGQFNRILKRTCHITVVVDDAAAATAALGRTRPAPPAEAAPVRRPSQRRRPARPVPPAEAAPGAAPPEKAGKPKAKPAPGGRAKPAAPRPKAVPKTAETKSAAKAKAKSAPAKKSEPTPKTGNK
jgi:large subunit ribosomal protein L22